MDKLAYIGKITEINPIENADRLEAATIVCGKGGIWHGVVQKGQFKPGDLAEAYLQDCLLPHESRFSFMENKGWRIKICRFRGALSECLIMPLTQTGEVGSDIGDIIGVDRYIKQLPPNINGEAKGNFPGYVPKTDEINFQAAGDLVRALWGKPFYVSIKADGSSFQAAGDLVRALWGKPFYVSIKADGSSYTALWDVESEEVLCCSRNLALKRTERSKQYQIADKYNLTEVLKNSPYAIQAELVGPGIQKNPLQLPDIDIRVFDVYDIGAREYLSPKDMLSYAGQHGLPTVTVVELGERIFSLNDSALIALAEAQTYPSGKPAEGVVIRETGRARRHDRISFKVINPLYGA